MKEVKTEVSGGLVPILLVGRTGVAKATHTQFHQDIQCSPNLNPTGYFMGVEKLILTFTLGGRGLRMASVVLKKKSRPGLMLPDLDSV